MSKGKKNKAAKPAVDSVESIDNALSRSEQFIENNQKSLTIIVVAVLVILGIYFGYKNWYLAPMEEEARSQIFNAEYYFERDSFRLALEGTENDLGFLEIADQYSASKMGNLANYYCGICYREMGQYELAIDYLKKFDAGDQMVTPTAYGAIGDCYVELNDLGEAAKYYEKAASFSVNDFITPVFNKKAALVYVEMGEYQKALKLYQQLKADFPRSADARDVDKEIARVNALMNR